MGSFAVVLETVASGISSLPFSTFVTLMQPIHLGIGIIEGVVTAAVISFVYKARPEIILMEQPSEATQGVALKNLLLGFIAASLLTGGVVSWYASENPDGLEWAIMKTTGHQELEEGKADVHSTLTTLQKKLAFLPGYSFRRTANVLPQNPTTPGKVEQNMETGVSGITGGGITLLLVFFIGYFLKKRSQVTSPQGR
jgi:cobalt/nickel transport system permease protein